MPLRRRESKQLSKARFIRFARRTITIGLNPFWMLDAQGVMYLSLKFIVGADLIRPTRKSLCFHRFQYRQRPQHSHFAYAGFLTTTREMARAPSFEIEERLPQTPYSV